MLNIYIVNSQYLVIAEDTSHLNELCLKYDIIRSKTELIAQLQTEICYIIIPKGTEIRGQQESTN